MSVKEDKGGTGNWLAAKHDDASFQQNTWKAFFTLLFQMSLRDIYCDSFGIISRAKHLN
jgi:hypothetical protein